jgi:drug/metabolite transporter (DMT)-like permease
LSTDRQAVSNQPAEPTARPLRTRAQLRLIFPFALVTLLWSTTWIVIRDQITLVPATWSLCYRFIAAAGAMWLWVLVTRQPWRLAPRGHPFVMVFSVIMFVMNFNFVYRAEAHVTSGVVAVAFALLVVPNAVLGRIFLGQHVTPRFALGATIGVAGVALLFVHEIATIGETGGNPLLGIAMTMIAVSSASIANVMQGSAAATRHPLSAMLVWGMTYGAIANGIVAFALYGPPVVDPRPGYLFGLLYLGIAASMLAFQFYFRLIRELGPARAGYVNVLVPVLAMIISSLVEGYRWTTYSVAGAVLAILGLVVALRARSPAR